MYRTVGHPADVASADVNRDGRLDLIAAADDRRGMVSVFITDGAGRFHRGHADPSGGGAPGAAAADVNHDGLVDVLTANLGRRDLSVLLGRGGGRFGAPVRVSGGDGAVDLDVGDLNGDGNLDVALATAYRGDAAVIRLGNGDGTFGPKTRYEAREDPDGVALADLNHDGRLDLAVSNADSGSVSVFLGRGDGRFDAGASYKMSTCPDAVVIADFDADGLQDIATSGVGCEPAVARGRGDGTFATRRLLDWLDDQGGAVADFNQDGRPDLPFASTDSPSADVFLNWTGLPAPPCVVLDLRNVRLPTAERDLRHDGCRLGQVHRRYSRSVRKNHVISPRPRIGSVLPSRRRVDLVVSRGRRRR